MCQDGGNRAKKKKLNRRGRYRYSYRLNNLHFQSIFIIRSMSFGDIPQVTILMLLHPPWSDYFYYLCIMPLSLFHLCLLFLFLCLSRSLQHSLSPPIRVSTFSSLILFCTPSHSPFFPSHPSSSGCPWTRGPSFIHCSRK